MNEAARRALRELVAATVEEYAAELAAVLRAQGGSVGALTLELRVVATEDELPAPEQGDEDSGRQYGEALRAGAFPPPPGVEIEQDGHTEDEWRDRQVRRSEGFA